MRSLKPLLIGLVVLCVLVLGYFGYSVVSYWYTENYVDVKPGEVIYESMYLGDTRDFAFDGIGSLNCGSRIIDESGPHIVINTEKLAADVAADIQVAILDNNQEVLETARVKAIRLHSLACYTSTALADASYITVTYKDVTVTIDAGVLLLLGLYI